MSQNRIASLQRNRLRLLVSIRRYEMKLVQFMQPSAKVQSALPTQKVEQLAKNFAGRREDYSIVCGTNSQTLALYLIHTKAIRAELL